MRYKDITPPAGDKITRGQTLSVPDHPVIPFIRGDGTGPDIWAASVRVFDGPGFQTMVEPAPRLSMRIGTGRTGSAIATGMVQAATRAKPCR